VAEQRSMGAIAEAFMRGIDVAPGVSGAREPYAQLVSVFRGMNIIANALGRVPIELWRGDEQVIAGPAVELLRRPNNAMRWRKFIETIVIKYHSGDAFVRLGPRTSLGLPTVLEILEGARPVREHEENLYELKEWETQVGNMPKPVALKDMVRIEYAPSPDPFVGMSCFIPGKVSMDAELMAAHYQRSTMKRGGTPGSLLTKKAGAKLTTDDKRLAEIEWEAKFGSTASGGNRVAILNDEWDYKVLGLSPKDMEFLQLRNWSIGEIARMLNIPTLYLSHFEGGSGLGDARWRAEERGLYFNNIIPLASKIAEEFTEMIFRPYDPHIECVFNFDEVEALRDDLREKSEVMARLVAAGFTADQCNERLDMGFDTAENPWQHEWLVSMGLTTARSVVEQSRLEDDQAAAGPDAGMPPMAPQDEGPTPEQEQDAQDAHDTTQEQVSHDERDAQLGAEAAALDRALVEPQGIPANLRAALSRARRTAAHRSFLHRLVKNEAAMDRKIRNVMTRQRKAVEKALLTAAGVSKRTYLRAMQDTRATGSTGLDAPASLGGDDIAAILAQVVSGTTVSGISRNMEEAYRAGSSSLEQMLQTIGVPQDDLFQFQEQRLPQLASNFVDKRLRAEPAKIDDTTRTLVNRSLMKVLDSGGTLRDAMQGIRDVFNASLSRARTIARTESTIASNAGRFEMMEDQLVYEHEWMATIDNVTRPDHVELDGEVRTVGDDFLPGLKFPGDPDCDDPGQIINCRCTTAPLSARRRSEREKSPDDEESDYEEAAVRAPPISDAPVRTAAAVRHLRVMRRRTG
jgi:HK97 family phage portal protein